MGVSCTSNGMCKGYECCASPTTGGAGSSGYCLIGIPSSTLSMNSVTYKCEATQLAATAAVVAITAYTALN